MSLISVLDHAIQIEKKLCTCYQKIASLPISESLNQNLIEYEQAHLKTVIAVKEESLERLTSLFLASPTSEIPGSASFQKSRNQSRLEFGKKI